MKSQNYFKPGVNRKVWSIYLLKPLPFEANTFIHQKVQTCASFGKQKCSQNYFTAKTTPPYQPPSNHARISGGSNFYWNWVANVYLVDRGREGGAGGGYAGASGRSARSFPLVYRASWLQNTSAAGHQLAHQRCWQHFWNNIKKRENCTVQKQLQSRKEWEYNSDCQEWETAADLKAGEEVKKCKEVLHALEWAGRCPKKAVTLWETGAGSCPWRKAPTMKQVFCQELWPCGVPRLIIHGM